MVINNPYVIPGMVRNPDLRDYWIQFAELYPESTKRSRKTSIRKPRQVFMYLMAQKRFKWVEIGRICGNFDHSTVIHAAKQIEDQLEVGYQDVIEIKDQLDKRFKNMER